MASEVRPTAIRIADGGGRIGATVYLLMVQHHRKIARASRAAAELAGTGEQQGQPTR
jgi:hypothetical protein